MTENEPPAGSRRMPRSEMMDSLSEVMGYAELRCLISSAVGGAHMDPVHVVRLAIRHASDDGTLDDDRALVKGLIRRVRRLTRFEMTSARASGNSPPSWARTYLFSWANLAPLDEASHFAALEFSLNASQPGMFPVVRTLMNMIDAERRRRSPNTVTDGDATPELRHTQ